jgi:myo-inositol-1(or 4)-monophosphatase
MNPLAWSVTELLELLLECGRIGRHYFEMGEWWLKRDQTLITKADLEIEALIARHCDRPEAGSWMLGEETAEELGEEYIRALLGSRAWLVDPIDGTAPFAHRLAYWGTSIGLMENGRLCEGAVILPQQGELFISNGAEVFYAENVDVQAGAEAVDLCLLAPTPKPPRDGGMIAISQAIAKRGVCRWPNPVQATGCAVSSLLYLLLGRYLAYAGHVRLWDLAGALPLLLKSGFEAVRFSGAEVSDAVNNDTYVLDPAAPGEQRWALRGGAVFAPRGVARGIRAGVELSPS